MFIWFTKARTGIVGGILLLLVLAACQTTTTTPVSADKANALITGAWEGDFINRQNTRYPVRFQLQGSGGQITGTGHIPDSSRDVNPTVTGTYSDNKIAIETSSGFRYDLTMGVSEDGTHWLTGSVTGPNSGRLELKRI